MKEWKTAKHVAVYLSLGDEPNLDPLIVTGQSVGKVMAVPRYEKSKMHFVKLVTPLTDLPGKTSC